jgi:hypothetical protein
MQHVHSCFETGAIGLELSRYQVISEVRLGIYVPGTSTGCWRLRHMSLGEEGADDGGGP